ncbi:MAG: efflux RND transporter permease subunit [bacterium]|nr:efflux RND transporter permease subunit [bacterium]
MLRTALQRPVAVVMLFLALLLIGVLSYQRLPVDLLPSITYPKLTVMTIYEDIPAEDLERLVTQRLEEVITGLSGVRGVVSRTREGVSTITVEYEWSRKDNYMDFANLHLREAVDRVAFRDDFPDDAERPVILRWDPTSRPVSILVLEGDDRIEALTEFAREVVKPALEQVDGISQAEVVGGADREILVQPDPRKLAIYGVDMEDVSNALNRSNISFPGGKVRQGPLHLSLRIDGEFESLDEIAATDITRAGDSPIRVSDVARVLDTIKEPEGVTLLGDRPVVSMLVYKEPEANTIKVSESVDDALEAVVADFGDFEFSFVYRDSEYVQASFDGLKQSLLVGAGLAILVLFLFLRDLRSPIVVGVAIPVSIVITFGALYGFDVKLNLMSLGGLSLAAGMLVDNSIVVLENINRHLHARRREDEEQTDAPKTEAVARRRRVANAARIGTTEVARPVIAATLTTVAVFFPVVYVSGIAGEFFKDQALTVTLSLLVSVFAALLLQPVLASRVLKSSNTGPRGLFRALEWGFERFHDGYHVVLVRALRHPLILLLVLVVGLTGVGMWTRNLDRSFMPERSLGDLRLDLELPAGTPLEETAAGVADLAGWIQQQDGVAAVFSQVGRTERTLAAMKDYVAPNTGRMRIILEQSRGARERGRQLQGEIASRIAQRTSDVHHTFRDEGIGLGEILGSGGAEFNMGVLSEDPTVAANVADRIVLALADVEGLSDLQVDRVLGTPNVVVRLDREEILRRNLDPDRLARELRARIAGVEATFFNEIDQRIDIAVRFDRDERRNLTAALASPVRLAGGRTVPLETFLQLVEERPVRELTRRDQRRMVNITGDVRGRGVEEVWEDALDTAYGTELPGGVRLVQEGEQKEMLSSFRELGLAMLLAVLLVYMILAAQFESFLDPLLIAAVIPIGLAGSAVAIGVTGGSINILSMIGVLALLGIAVNDAIVKIDTIRRLREEGTPGPQAILEASKLRLRPILMTSVTTILAMLPMAIGLGSGEQLQRPLAITIIGGLALTTSLTLFFTPILYQLAHRIRRPEVGA